MVIHSVEELHSVNSILAGQNLSNASRSLACAMSTTSNRTHPDANWQIKGTSGFRMSDFNLVTNHPLPCRDGAVFYVYITVDDGSSSLFNFNITVDDTRASHRT